MNKQAAEKIASEYYNAGLQIAIKEAGLTKVANKGLAALLGGGATLGGAGVLSHANPELLAKLLRPGQLAAETASPHMHNAMEYLGGLKNSLLG